VKPISQTARWLCIATVLVVGVAGLMPRSAVAAPRLRSTDHFLISYRSGFGSGASSETYVDWVEAGLETAVSVLLKAGFSIYSGQIPVYLVDSVTGELGAEYLEFDGDGGWSPVIEIAVEATMAEYLAYAYVETTMEDLVRSTCAHEVFHVVQEYHSAHGIGDISEQSWIEAHATAVQEFVVPTANDYLEPALEFLLAPDGMAFLQRTYDAGIFWVFAMQCYGIDVIFEVMLASAVYDGIHALDAGLHPFGTSFLDLWSEFAVALATNALPDAAVIASAVPMEEGHGWWTRTRDPAPIPPPVHHATWTGEAVTIDAVNARQQSEWIPLYEDDPIGTSLRIAHAYGIDVVEVLIEAPKPLLITFDGASDSTFRTWIASETADGWTSLPLNGTATIEPDEAISRLRLVVTRSEPGSGAYTVVLRSP